MDTNEENSVDYKVDLVSFYNDSGNSTPKFFKKKQEKKLKIENFDALIKKDVLVFDHIENKKLNFSNQDVNEKSRNNKSKININFFLKNDVKNKSPDKNHKNNFHEILINQNKKIENISKLFKRKKYKLIDKRKLLIKLETKNKFITTKEKKFFNPFLIKDKNFKSKIIKNLHAKKKNKQRKKFSIVLKKINSFKKLDPLKKKYLDDKYELNFEILFPNFKVELEKDLIVKKHKKIRKRRRKKFLTCNCKTSFCILNYCKCKSSNKKCNKTCKCLNCKNN